MTSTPDRRSEFSNVTAQEQTEWLVVLRASDCAELIEALVPVRQRLGDRVLIVEAADPTLLRRLRYVRAVTDRALDPALVADLSDTERLFIDAWVANRTTKKPARRGDGLDWDSEGYEPP